jgi:hypothetical protein
MTLRVDSNGARQAFSKLIQTVFLLQVFATPDTGSSPDTDDCYHYHDNEDDPVNMRCGPVLHTLDYIKRGLWTRTLTNYLHPRCSRFWSCH